MFSENIIKALFLSQSIRITQGLLTPSLVLGQKFADNLLKVGGQNIFANILGSKLCDCNAQQY